MTGDFLVEAALSLAFAVAIGLLIATVIDFFDD